MNNIRLYLYNENGTRYEVDLNEQVVFSITKQFEDISSPASIINDWSKGISIPFTNHNHEVFGDIYKVDRLVTKDSQIGNIGFDCYLKVKFTLEWNDSILFSGYMKFVSVEMDSPSKGKYNITLNGELGRVFNELKKITLDTDWSTGLAPEEITEQQKYFVDGSHIYEEELSKTLIYNSWTGDPNPLGTFEPKYKKNAQGEWTSNPNYVAYNIVGWAPNNAFSNEFSYTSYLPEGTTEIKNLTDILQTRFNLVGFTDVTAESVVGDGITPRGLGNFRSYNQLPFIYVPKLFDIFKEKAKDILPDYTIDLDANWFTSGNPYWQKQVMMLKPIERDNDDDKDSTVEVQASGSTINYVYAGNDSYSPSIDNYQPSTITFSSSQYTSGSAITAGTNEHLIPMFDIPIRMTINRGFTSQITTIEEASYVNITLTATGQITGTSQSITKKIVFAKSFTPINNSAEVVLKGLYFSSLLNNESYTISMSVKLSDYNFSPFTYYKSAQQPRVVLYDVDFSLSFPSISTNIVIGDKRKRSFYIANLNDLWDNDKNMFDIILNYCKVHRILIQVDDINKSIKLLPAHTYFRNYTVEDWSDKVDYSKQYKIEPIVPDSKYLVFNYEDSLTQIGDNYKDDYGLNFGEKRLQTPYNFDTNSKDMFSSIPCPIAASDTFFSWESLYEQRRIRYSCPNEVYVNNKGFEWRQVDTFGQFFFFKKEAFEQPGMSPLYLRPVHITDDSFEEIRQDTYCYSYEDKVSVGYYNKLSNVAVESIAPGLTYRVTNLYNIPARCYEYNTNYNDVRSIYTDFWERYLNERYNRNCKKLTCRIMLKPTDWINFRHNKFVIINNNLFFVNKINNYKINSIEPTEVELFTVNDIHGYTNQSTGQLS